MKNERHARTILEAFGCDSTNSNPMSGPYTEHHNPIQFIVAAILMFLAIMISIHVYSEDENMEIALSAADRMTVLQIKQCLDERGQGAAPLFDAEGNYKDCKQRRKS